MINILSFFVTLIIPGACVLWLINASGMFKFELRSGGSLWLTIPTSLAASIGIISLLGWIGFYLKLGFTEVRLAFIVILGILILASLIKVWKKRLAIKVALSKLKLSSHSLISWELAIVVLIGIVLILANYGGAWFSHTADSLNHIAGVRSVILFNNPVPMQIHWPVPVSGMDPTYGTWHLALAIWASFCGIELTTMWLLATIMLAPIIVLTFIVLAFEFTHSKIAALIAGVLYVIVIISADFRVSAQPNRMGQIIFWLVFVFLVLAINSIRQQNNRSGLIFATFAIWFAWTSSAIHLQYIPALLGIAVPGLAFIFIFDYVKAHRQNNDQNNKHSSIWKAELAVSVVFLISALFGFVVRSSFSISEKTPFLSQASQDIEKSNSIDLIVTDLNEWFTAKDSVTVFATLFSLSMVYYAIKGGLGAVFIFVSSLLLPAYVVFITLFVGRGGLLYSTFTRLVLLTPAFLIIGWAWALSIAISLIATLKNRLDFQKYLMLGVVTLVLGVSIITVYQRVINPQGGVISLYSPSSEYSYRIALSRQMSLLKTRGDAIHFINTIPAGERIMADEGIGYELICLTGKYFIRLPSQHMPVQEKALNDYAYQDVVDFMSGNFDNRQMVEALLRQKVNYVYVDKERYNGPIIWDRLDTLAFLDEAASAENWRLYRFDPDKAEDFLVLDEKISNTSGFIDKLTYYRELENLFADSERYARQLAQMLSVDPSFALDFVKEGSDFQTPDEAGVSYNFINHINDATQVIADNNPVTRTAYIIKGETRGVIFQHPASQLIYSVDIPANSQLDFSIALDPAVWEIGLGDGVEFRISIKQGSQNRLVFDEYIDPKNLISDRRWFNYSLDLSAYSGKNVTIIFETRPGFQNNTRFDWSGWGEPRIRYKEVDELFTNWDMLTIEKDENVEVKQITLKIAGDKRYFIFQHPESRISTQVYIPFNAELHVGLGMDPEIMGSGKSDGIVYRIYIQNPQNPDVKYRIFDYYLAPENQNLDQAWQDVVLDLSRFGGSLVKITFETLPGPINDSAFDWGGWSLPYIVENQSTK